MRSKQVAHLKVTEAMLRAYLRAELSAAESDAISEIVRNSYFYSKVLEGMRAELNAEKEAAENPDMQDGFLYRLLKGFFRQVKKLPHQCSEGYGVKKPKPLQLAI